MKLYSVLVLNNIQKYKKNNIEAPRKNETSSISKTYIVILSSQTASNHIITSIAAALNWSERGLIGGRVPQQYRLSGQRWADGIYM